MLSNKLNNLITKSNQLHLIWVAIESGEMKIHRILQMCAKWIQDQ